MNQALADLQKPTPAEQSQHPRQSKAGTEALGKGRRRGGGGDWGGPGGGGARSPRPGVLSLQCASAAPGVLQNTDCGPHSHFLSQQVWGRAQEYAFLTSSRTIWMLPIWGPQLEHHCSDLHTQQHMRKPGKLKILLPRPVKLDSLCPQPILMGISDKEPDTRVCRPR